MINNQNETFGEAAEVLQGVIDALPGSIAILDAAGNIIAVNKSWNGATGENRLGAARVGSNYPEICANFAAGETRPAAVGAKIAEGISDVLGGRREKFELEYELSGTDETEWFITRARGFGNTEKPLFIVSHEDVSERKFTERALLESEQNYRILAETASDAIIKIDGENKILFANRAAERVFGYKPFEMLGKPLELIIPAALNEEYPNGFAAFLKTGANDAPFENLEVSARHQDRHIFPLEISFGADRQNQSNFFIGIARDISARQSTVKATAHLAAIVESSGDAIISKNLDGIITSWNNSAQRIFGYTAEEAVGQSVLMLIPPFLQNEEATILGRVRSNERIEHYETVRRRKDGTLISVSLTVSPIRDTSGNIIGASKIVRDITERKETEQQLIENQIMLSLAMQASRMGVWEHDIATGFVYWSEELEEIFGIEKGSFKQTRAAFYEFLHADDRERIWMEVENAIREKRSYEIEFRFYHADGSIRWMEGRGKAVYSESGEPVRVFGIGVDITDRKNSEEKLRESEERYRTLFNSIDEGFCVFEMIFDENNNPVDYRFLEINPMFAKLTGLENALGKTARELLPDLEPQWFEKYGKVALTGESIRFTDGSEVMGRWFDVYALRLGGAESRRVALIFNNITERMKTEQLLRQNAKQLSLVTDIVPVFLTQFDRNERCKFINKPNADRFGLTPDEIVGKHIKEVIGAEAYQTIRKYIEIVLSGEAVEFETEVPYKFGKQFIHTFYVPEFDEEGNVIGWVAAITDVSERRKAEEKLRESEARFRQMADSAPVMIWVTDAAGSCTFLSKSWYEFTGQTPETGLGFGWLEATHPDDRQITHEIFEAAVEKQEGFYIEYRLLRTDGEYRWAIDSAVPRFSDNGEYLGYIGSVIDITERKLAEDKLIKSQNHLKLTTEAANLGTWQWNLQSDSFFWSPIHRKMWGYAPEPTPLSYKEWTDLLHPDDLEAVQSAIETSLQTHGVYDVEFRVFPADDSPMRWIRSIGQVTLDEKGEPVQMYGVSQDITEQKYAQEAILKAERRALEDYLELLSRIVPLGQTLGTARELDSIYRAIRDFVKVSMPCSAFFVSFYDAEKSLRTAAYVWGENGEVDISTLPPMLLTKDGGPNSQAIFQKKSVVARGFMDSMKDRPHVIVGDDGIDPSSSLVVPMTVMNRIIGTLEVQAYESEAFTSDDIIALEMVANLASVAIENVRLLENEAQSRREAEAANRAKDEFLSVLSHELRTPLNAILGWTRLLKTGLLDDERKRQAVETIERNTRLQNNLIEDLLDVSRIISGKMRIEEEEIEFVGIVNAAIETMRPLAEVKNIRLELESEIESRTIMGDATRLQQIIANLTNNAIKFTPEGGFVTLHLSETDTHLRLKIADSGIGISPEFLPYIFDRFRQADSTTRRHHSGLGLGLTIVHHLIELHGGRITAASEGAGKGAQFTVEIPIIKKIPLIYPSFSGEDYNSEVFNHSVLKDKSILLIDDDCDGIYPLELFLKKSGAQVFCLNSAAEALRLLNEKSFDLLVSDIGMPGLDGYGLISQIRESSKNPAVPAIALTAYASTEDRERALASGFQKHLTKPVDFDNFFQTVVNLLKENERR